MLRILRYVQSLIVCLFDRLMIDCLISLYDSSHGDGCLGDGYGIRRLIEEID